MSKHGYDSGRLNLPFVGICTFGKYPYVEDWDAIEADVAVMGAPFDFGTQWRSGARMGPRAIREASTLFSFGHAGAYDHEDDVTYLDPAKVTIVDIGDADIVHTNTEMSHANIAFGVRKILAAGAIPIVLGGDPSEGAQRPIQEARNQVRACSIWVASASLMGENIQGLSLEEANNLGTTFREAMETGELPDSPPEFLPPLMAIRKHKSRIRCAALAWNALEECTQQVTNPKSEG